MSQNECPTCHRSRTHTDVKCWWCGMELPTFQLPQQPGMMALTAQLSMTPDMRAFIEEYIKAFSDYSPIKMPESKDIWKAIDEAHAYDKATGLTSLTFGAPGGMKSSYESGGYFKVFDGVKMEAKSGPGGTYWSPYPVQDW